MVLGKIVYGNQNYLECGHCGKNIEVWEYATELHEDSVIDCDSCGLTMRVTFVETTLDLHCTVIPNLPEMPPA